MNKTKTFAVAFTIILTTLAFGQELPARYHRYTQVLDTLTILKNAYPQILRLDTMGYSTRDSVPMLRLKISDNPRIDEDEPAVFVFGGEHADEVLGPEIVLGFIKDILHKYALEDPTVTRYVTSIEIFAIPFINPEGHIVVENGDFDWRKNKCDNDHNGIFDFHDGVDNNRNYDFGWSIDNSDTATTPESLMYKGTAPFTQLENLAIRDFAWKYRPLVALDYHSPTYGRAEKAYYPWWWYSNVGGHGEAPDGPMMLDICSQYCSRIIRDAGGDSTYEARRALVNKGDLKTYLYGNFGTAAFTVEVSDTTIQTPSLVDGIVSRNLAGIYYLLGRTLGPGVTGIIRDSVTLEPLEAEVQVLERINADINPRLSRPDYGRYRRFLASGTYTLRFIKTDYRQKTVNNVSVGTTNPTTVDVLLGPLHPRPPAPQLIYPPLRDTVRVRTFVFDWSDISLATKYRIEVASDSLFTDLVILDSSVTNSSFTVETPMADGHYYWRVKGGNTNGWGPYSGKIDFFVEAQVGIGEDGQLPIQFGLSQNVPNPFNASTEIAFDLPRQSKVSLQIFDITGAKVADLLDAILETGHHSIIWNGKDDAGQPLASGVYFYRIRFDSAVAVKKMILLK
jgi:hypothetical protein